MPAPGAPTTEFRDPHLQNMPSSSAATGPQTKTDSVCSRSSRSHALPVCPRRTYSIQTDVSGTTFTYDGPVPEDTTRDPKLSWIRPGCGDVRWPPG